MSEYYISERYSLQLKIFKLKRLLELEEYSKALKLKYEINNSFINSLEYINEFINCCKNGELKMAKLLFSVNKEIIGEEQLNKGFRECCRCGHLKMAKWVYRLCKININIDNDDYTKHYKYYNIDVAKWLYNLKENNDRVNRNEVFIILCKGGNYDLAKWFYVQGEVDIHFNNDDGFKHCYNMIELLTHIRNMDGRGLELTNCWTQMAKWLIRIGIVVKNDNYLYEYYLKIKRRQFRSLVILSIFVVKIQQKYKEYLYNPEDGILMLRAKEKFEKK